MKIVFFGTPEFVDPVLKKLEENFEVVKTIRSPQQFINEAIEQLSALSPDLFVVASYGQILPGELLSIPKLGAINIHPSLLPKYRGPSPIQSAILNSDKKTGVTFIEMDEEIDHGPIIEQFEEEILDSDTFETLAVRLFNKSADKIADVINDYQVNQTTKPQDDSKASYAKVLTKKDGFIDIGNAPAKQKLERMIRAYFPWPGVWTHYPLQATTQTLIKLLPNQKIQVEGKKPMSYKDFINGYANGEKFLRAINLIPN